MKATAIDYNYNLVTQTYFSGLLILCKHLVPLFLPFFLLQLLSGQWVAVVVSRQQTEITILLRVKVETWQLWTQKNCAHLFSTSVFTLP